MSQNSYPPQYERFPGDNGTAYTPSEPPKKSRRGLWILGGILLGLIALVVILVAVLGDPKTAQNVPQPSHAATATAHASRAIKAAPPVSAKPKVVTAREGKWEVPTEVKPGTYTTTAGTDNIGGCYVARLHDFDGGINSIIANDNVNPGAHGRIVIKATDKGVEFTGPCVWTKVK
jgi:hypothetical protein